MSTSSPDRSWGPSYEYLTPRTAPRVAQSWRANAHRPPVRRVAADTRTGPFAAGGVAFLGHALLTRFTREERSTTSRLSEHLTSAPPRPGDAVREHFRRLGGGAFLGVAAGGRWVTADPEHAVMVLGPPTLGQDERVVIPALLAAPGAALVSTSTKPDVLRRDDGARAHGSARSGCSTRPASRRLPAGVRRLSWSPVGAASTWDEALLTRAAMTPLPRPRQRHHHEHHWSERAAALLAPLLYAAHLTDGPIADVLRWVLRHDLEPPGRRPRGRRRRRSPTTCSSGSPRPTSASAPRSSPPPPVSSPPTTPTRPATPPQPRTSTPTRSPPRPTRSTSPRPAHRQALCAPLVVGLLGADPPRHLRTRRHAPRPPEPPVFFCLDEVANIAPIHDLPALVSEAGGQGLHVMVCLQDLSQARTRWGDAAADGFLSLFQTKLILTGIADPRTLEAISPRPRRIRPPPDLPHPRPHRDPQPLPRTQHPTHPDRERHLPNRAPAHPAARRHRTAATEHGLLLRGTHWGLLRLTPWHRTQPWVAVAEAQTLDAPRLAA